MATYQKQSPDSLQSSSKFQHKSSHTLKGQSFIWKNKLRTANAIRNNKRTARGLITPCFSMCYRAVAVKTARRWIKVDTLIQESNWRSRHKSTQLQRPGGVFIYIYIIDARNTQIHTGEKFSFSYKASSSIWGPPSRSHLIWFYFSNTRLVNFINVNLEISFYNIWIGRGHTFKQW